MFGKSSKKMLDFSLEDRLNEITELLDNIASEGNSVEDEIEDAKSKMKDFEDTKEGIMAELSDVQELIDSIRSQLEQAEEKRGSINAELNTTNEQISNFKEQIINRSTHLSELLDDYKFKGEEMKKLRNEWKNSLKKYASEKGTISSWSSFGERSKIESVFALGDIHGWAPGLFNAITEKSGFNFSLLGQPLNSENMAKRFENPLTAARAGRFLPRVGLNGHPLRENSEPTPFDGLEIHGNSSGKLFVQVGDLIDRGDHNELILEACRQMQIHSPGSLIFTIGNHESWIIEGDFETWKRNEDRYRMQGRPRPGTTIHDPIMTGAADLEKSMRLSFKILEGALGASLLTQHFSVMECLDKKSAEKFRSQYEKSISVLGFSEKKLKKMVLAGGWKLHDIGRQALSDWREASKKSKIPILGSYSMVCLDGAVFMHAEPNAVAHSSTNLTSLMADMNFMGRNMMILPSEIERNQLGNQALLFARSKDDDVRVEDGLTVLKNHILSMDSVVHGHTPIIENPSSDFIIKGEIITVTNCDHGMTPFYRALRFDDAYDTSIVPFLHEVKLSEGVIEDE